jgi:hypothetical protein
MIEQSPVFLPYRYQYVGNPRMLGERSNGMAQHRGAAERKILLGHGTAEPTTPAGRDNEGIYENHVRYYRMFQGLAIRCPNVAVQKDKG